MLGRNILLCREPSKHAHYSCQFYVPNRNINIVYKSNVEKNTIHKCSAAATGLLPINDSLSSSRP